MLKQETYIGRVMSVNGSVVSIQLDDAVYRSAMPIINGIVYRVGQIGSFVKIPLGYSLLYGVVTQAGVNAIPEKYLEAYSQNFALSNNRWLSVVLVGEMIRRKFERGVAQFPTAQDEAHLVTMDDLSNIYSDFNRDSSIIIGKISASESLPAYLYLDKLVTRHCAILGSTGSGKSNAVSVILDSIANHKDLKSQRILVIDPHGEYNEVLSENCRVYKINSDPKEQNELYIPYWALPFEEFISLFPGKLNDAQKDSIRMEVVRAKIASSKKMKPLIDENSITSDSPLPFSLKALWHKLDDFERQTFTDNGRINKTAPTQLGDATKYQSTLYPAAAPGGGSPFLNNKALGILSFLDSLKNRALDERFKFLFKCGEYEPDLIGKVKSDLNKLLSDWLGHDKQITILDLSGIPPEIMISISGALLKIIYDALFWGQNLNIGGRKQPLLVVLEEAHNYLKAGENSISSRTVQTIAKEGRKYGVGLMLVTQRPSELDETTLSQCGSVISLRMMNSKDKSHVASAVEDSLQDLVNILPSLRTGEGIVMGEVVKIPSRIKFDKIGKAPKSTDPKVSIEWKKDKPNPNDYKKVVELWRSGKFK